MNERVKAVLNGVLEQFRCGEVPQAVAYSVINTADLPSSRWSILNRMIMFLAGTGDARTYRQWRVAGRHVKSGKKAFSIVVPYIRNVEDENGDEVAVLSGFGLKAVFRKEDTAGAPLVHEPPSFHDLPLIERAKEWGISVRVMEGHDFGCYGLFSPSAREIRLATEAECVFFHELSHAAHSKINGSLKPGQHPLQEIVAEFSSQCLCRLVGKSGDKYFGNSYRYVEHYAKRLGLNPYSAAIRVLNETEKVLKLVISGDTLLEGH